jgi:hypothetical protein
MFIVSYIWLEPSVSNFSHGYTVTNSSNACFATTFLVPEVNALVHIIQRLKRSISLPQDPALEPVWSSLAALVGDEATARYGKEVIKFLKRALLSLWEE